MSAVSEDALQSAQVARRSLEAAQKGAAAVEDSIKGMNDIREQIQETSKRIKRLGESSQEIGEIVELISDITEQTNVLALNAAIQAASAGEAGRGFTVVAEEVQRLAERSAEATKQIAAIVKTIQTDTGDAVAAMENSTRDVVDGAKLSDAAGQALQEISSVSTNLATPDRIDFFRHPAAGRNATRVAQNMQSILRVTEQTTSRYQATAVSIGQLAELASNSRVRCRASRSKMQAERGRHDGCHYRSRSRAAVLGQGRDRPRPRAPHEALGKFTENPGDSAQLKFARTHLHQAMAPSRSSGWTA
jgi:twitching motility protein PilJ